MNFCGVLAWTVLRCKPQGTCRKYEHFGSLLGAELPLIDPRKQFHFLFAAAGECFPAKKKIVHHGCKKKRVGVNGGQRRDRRQGCGGKRSLVMPQIFLLVPPARTSSVELRRLWGQTLITHSNTPSSGRERGASKAKDISALSADTPPLRTDRELSGKGVKLFTHTWAQSGFILVQVKFRSY